MQEVAYFNISNLAIINDYALFKIAPIYYYKTLNPKPGL
jgi:hypothetical protein